VRQHEIVDARRRHADIGQLDLMARLAALVT
jgi:hypothetical protein